MKAFLISIAILVGIALPSWWFYVNAVTPRHVIEVQVSQSDGLVSRRLKDGQQTLVKAGDVLPQGTSITTGDNSRLSLKIGDGEDLVLFSASQMEIDEVTADGVRFTLANGKARAEVKRFSDRTVAVGLPDGKVTAATTEGSFEVAASESGSMTAALSGQVQLLREGRAPETLAPGQAAAVDPEGASTSISAIPRSVILKVNWPSTPSLRTTDLEVTGHASPGARVLVGGKPARVARDGTFKANVPLQEGNNQVKVSATGIGESAEEVSPELKVDTRPPTVKSTTSDLWKGNR